MLTILTKNKNFRYLWLGQLISSLGDRLTQMGILTFVMVRAADKGDKMALITFFSLLPFSLFGPFFGALADRYSRKNLMIFADIMRAIFVVLIPVIWLNTHAIALIITWFFILGSLTALFTPAKMSIITNIADKDILLKANSVIVTTGMVTTLVGTLIAGIVIKITGIKAAFYINSLTYFISAFFIFMIIYKRQEYPLIESENIYPKIITEIKDGIDYIRSRRLIRQLISLSSVFSLVSSFAYILILNYGTSVLAQGPLGLGILLSSAGFGMAIGALILNIRKERVNYDKALYLSYFLIGVFTLAFLFKPVFFLTLVCLFGAGIGAAILTITLDTVFQRVTPDELKGKIFAARGMITNTVFLGCLLLVGALIKFVPVIILFGLVGSVSIIAFLGVFLYERRWGYQLLRLFLRLFMKSYFGFSVSGLKNLPKTRRVILAGNHTSIIDGVALACAYPRRIYFLVADTIFRTKPWGWLIKRLGYIPVKRGGFNKEAIREAVTILKSGYSIGIFPEGRISRDDKLDEGKAGIAIIAKLANVDVIPFAIEGAHEAWSLEEKYPRRFPISVRFGAPIDIKDYSVPQELVAEVMQDIAELKLYLEREGYLKAEPDEIVKHLINIG